jgi:hypothetical protein
MTRTGTAVWRCSAWPAALTPILLHVLRLLVGQPLVELAGHQHVCCARRQVRRVPGVTLRCRLCCSLVAACEAPPLVLLPQAAALHLAVVHSEAVVAIGSSASAGTAADPRGRLGFAVAAPPAACITIIIAICLLCFCAIIRTCCWRCWCLWQLHHLQQELGSLQQAHLVAQRLQHGVHSQHERTGLRKRGTTQAGAGVQLRKHMRRHTATHHAPRHTSL